MTRVLGVSMLLAALLPGAVVAAQADVHRALSQALTCEGSPLDTVGELASAGGSRVGDGFVGFEFGEEMDTVSGVALQSPLSIAGAEASTVIATLMSFHTDFDARVFARFKGDAARAASELDLARDAASGVFRRATTGSGADDVCPPTIELKPLDGGGFLLGCTWCNG